LENGSLVVLTQESQLQAVDPRTGSRSTLLDFSPDIPFAVSPGGKYIVYLQDDAEAGRLDTLRLTDLQTQEDVVVFKGHWDRIDRVSFSADMKTMASAASGTVILWDLEKLAAKRD